jgi:hypothetical protein
MHIGQCVQSLAEVFVTGLTVYIWQHAERVLKILELRDQIEGIVYCDYDDKDEDLLCKPEPAFYHQVGLFFSLRVICWSNVSGGSGNASGGGE